MISESLIARVTEIARASIPEGVDPLSFIARIDRETMGAILDEAVEQERRLLVDMARETSERGRAGRETVVRGIYAACREASS